MRIIIVVFIMLLVSGFNAYAVESEEYVLCVMATSPSESRNNTISTDYCVYESFSRDECAGEILKWFKKYRDSLKKFDDYVKNGVIKSEVVKENSLLTEYSRYICIPKSVMQRQRKPGGGFDLTGIKGIPNTIDESKINSYTILPLDKKDTARSQEEMLDKAVAEMRLKPSFSCNNFDALRHNEKLVCKNRDLAEKDLKLTELYKEAIEKSDAEERKWIKKASVNG